MEAFFDQCYALYQSVDPQLARKLAAKITEAINQALVEDTYAKSNSFTTPEAKYPINIPVQPAALPIPWQAYHAYCLGDADFKPDINHLEAVICTTPQHYQMLPVNGDNCLLTGSLINYVDKILNTAKDELIVINPYWSVSGVQRLLKRLSVDYFAPKELILVIPAGISESDKLGCECFLDAFQKKGSTKIVYTPGKDDMASTLPLVHAKALIADGKIAYIGSANLSDGGLLDSIELGVGINGSVVYQLREWVFTLTENMVRRHDF